MDADAAERDALLHRALDALDEMEAKLGAFEARAHEPIAVVGMGLRFPGGATDGDSFWDLLESGRDAVTEIPADRWDLDAIFDPNPGVAGKSYSKWGAFLDEVDRFDAPFFGISPREALTLDPQQRLLLEVAWEAIEHAGIATTDLAGSATGVFVGMIGSEYADLAVRGGIMADVDAYFASGAARSVAAGRLAYVLDVHGPAIAVDTACSSSLVATHLACQSLRSGECDAAIAGGVSLMLSSDGHIVTSQARMMSFEGRCKTFDASADGYVRGEGCGVIVLKRLSDAITAGDRVLGTIRGTAMNQDGRSNGLTAPNAAAQEAVIRAALADAGVESGLVDFVECHGTGTTLGDPIEIRALQSVYGAGRSNEDPLLVQSVKTNIGHLEAAAGIASLCKLLLAVDRGRLPSHLHLTDPNPYIPWNDIAVAPASAPVAWPGEGATNDVDHTRIGAISSFGFSGTNVHMVIEQAPPAANDESEGGSDVEERRSQAYTLSARTPAALDDVTRAHAAALANESVSTRPNGIGATTWRDAAHTANTGRTHFEERLAVVADSAAQAANRLTQAASRQLGPDVMRGRAAVDNGFVMMFTGQGSQVPGMGHRLYATEPAFRAQMDECAEVMREVGGIDLLDVMFATSSTRAGSSIDDTRFAQPALFAHEVSMAAMLRSWGLEPAAVLGHSVGELAAAHVAGVFELSDALTIIEARGRLMQSMSTSGSMAAVLADPDTVAAAIQSFEGLVSIAAINGPLSVVISGEQAALDDVIAQLEAAGTRVTRLTVSHAFHSSMMDPMLDPFEQVVASVTLSEPEIELISNATGVVAPPGLVTSARYWRDHVRRPVMFDASIRHAIEIGYDTFVEVGPEPTLSAMARAGGGAPEATFVPTARRNDESGVEAHRAVAALHVLGHELDWRAYDAGRPRRRIDIPTYRFERERFWHPTVGSDGHPPTPDRGRGDGESLLGRRLRSLRMAGAVYERELRTDSPAWLADHVVYGNTLVPATAMVEMMRHAGLATAADVAAGVIVTDVRIEEPLLLDDEVGVVVQTLVDELASDANAGRAVEIVSASGDTWTRHASGRLMAPATTETGAFDGDPSKAWPECDHAISGDEYYAALRSLGVDYGPTFRCIEVTRRCEGSVVATLRTLDVHEKLSDGPHPVVGQPLIHPAIADSCLQVLGLAMPGGNDLASPDGDVYVPVGIERWTVDGDATGTLIAHGRVRPGNEATGFDDVTIGDLELFSEDGHRVMHVEGVRFKRAPRSSLGQRRNEVDEWLYSLKWQPAPLPSDAAPAPLDGNWIVVGSGRAAHLVLDAMSGSGARPTLVDTSRAAAHSDITDDMMAAGLVEPGRTAGVVMIVPLAEPLHRSSAAWVASTVAFLDAADAAVPLYVVTSDAAPVVPGDRVDGYEQAAVYGVRRVAASEYPRVRCHTIDLETRPDGSPDVASLVEELLCNDADAPEVAWRGGVRYVSRLDRPESSQPLAVPDGRYILEIAERGRLDALHLAAQDVREPASGEVEIEVGATGLNFRDVLNVLGQYAGEASSLGGECTGTVVAVGDGVGRVAPGDRVMVVSDASFASRCVVPEQMVARQPHGYSDAEAATIPIAFLTADYALDHLGRLGAGERVLIHAATGGVGMAAVQLAQSVGAEIYATAGSDEKRALLRGLGVQHVYDSRSIAFREEILRDTSGAGVDVVLNSLTGDSIGASVDVLSSTGRFVEIGMAGIWNIEQFHAVRPQAEYHVVFLGQVCIDEPDFIAGRFDQLVERFDRGDLRPLPVTAFDIRQSVAAFRYMAQARHIGKVVLTAHVGWNIDEAGGTWIISGGLGGLGLTIAGALAEAGADRIVLCSRRPAADAAEQALQALAKRCDDVRVVAVDVGDRQAVIDMVADATADGSRLRGVVHAAAALDDALIRELTSERFDAVAHAKVRGAQHLAAACDPHRPQHFIMFSAGAALFGPTGQANYAAANAVLDALAHHRRAQGLPAQAIDWGPWTTVGMAAELGDDALRRWEAQGIVGITPDEGVAALRAATVSGEAQLAVLKLRWSALVHHFSKHEVPPIFRDLVGSEQRRSLPGLVDTVDLVDELADVDVEQRRPRLLAALREQVLQVLGLDPTYPVDNDRGLNDLGMDSLMAVELSNRLSGMIGQTLPTTLAFEEPTIGHLARHLEELLGAVVAFDDDGDEAVEVTASDPGRDDLDDLTTGELTDALLSALDDAGY